MANPTQVGIKASWPLLSFARMYDRMKVTSPMTNSETGETFRSCAFIDAAGAVTLVGFSSNLGELTPKQIAAQKNELQVVHSTQATTSSARLAQTAGKTWTSDSNDPGGQVLRHLLLFLFF